jgi:hypothetical protein
MYCSTAFISSSVSATIFELAALTSNMSFSSILDFYCSDHDDICCKSCIADVHRTCGKIKPLDVAAKGVKSAIMFDFVALKQGSQSCDEEAISFLKLNAKV